MSQDSGPGRHHALVTANDSTVVKARSLWVGGAGAANLQSLSDGEKEEATIKAGSAYTPNFVLFSGIPAGTTLPFGAYRVASTSTTATLIVAIY